VDSSLYMAWRNLENLIDYGNALLIGARRRLPRVIAKSDCAAFTADHRRVGAGA
jgi:hypothetical protein